MRCRHILVALLAISGLSVGPARADRPVERRERADYVVSGMVSAVYSRESAGYRDYIIEITVEAVEKGAGIKKGDTFRAFCYQRKEGKGGLEFDTAGHNVVPKEGQQIRAFVKRGNGRNEGVYPNWIDILSGASRKP
jgi:hypothetical protein